MRFTVLFAALAFAALVTGASPGVQAETSAETSDVEISLVSLAAWNGELEPALVNGVRIGGAAELASRFSGERAARPNTLVLGTGNSFGTSPPISNLFKDEPAVLAMNAMGFDADGLGNDNFDHGIADLQRLLTIADFPFLAANLEGVEANLAGVKGYRIFEVGGVRVAVIGVVDPVSATLVFPGNFGTITISDPAFAAFRAREAAAAEGAEVFVLITEMGLSSAESGPLLELARRVTGYDAILGNGNGWNHTSVINGARVTASMSRGLSYGRTFLTFSTAQGKVTASGGSFVQPVVTNENSGLAVAQLVNAYRSQLNGRLMKVISGSSVAVGQADVCGSALGRTCESLTANVVADAMRLTYDADIALLNSGGIRAGLTCPLADNAADFCPALQGPPFPITEGQVQAILPFGNTAAVMTITGADLKAMLEHGVSPAPENSGRFPQVSGFCFWYDPTRGDGSRVISAVRQGNDGSCSGAAIDFSASNVLTLVTNDFIAAGGDGYPRLAAAPSLRDRLDSVLSDYLQQKKTLSPISEGRITCIGTSCLAVIAGRTASLPAGTIRPPSTGDAGMR